MLLENAVCLEARLAPELRTVSRLTAAPELAVLGVLSTGIGFTLQIIAQRSTSPTEPRSLPAPSRLFGAAAATVLLGENLTLSAGVGATLILTATVLVQLPRRSFGPFAAVRRAACTATADSDATRQSITQSSEPRTRFRGESARLLVLSGVTDPSPPGERGVEQGSVRETAAAQDGFVVVRAEHVGA